MSPVRSEPLASSIVEAIDQIVYLVTGTRTDDEWHSATIEYVSGNVRALLGREPGEFTSNPLLWQSLVHPDDLPGLRDITVDAFRTGRPITRSYRMKHATTGDYRLFDDRLVPRLANDGSFVGFIGVARDVTDSRTVEQHLSIVLDRITDGFLTLNRDWRYTYVNKTGAALLKLAPQELVGRRMSDVFPEAIGTIYERAFRATMESGRPNTVKGYYAPLSRWFEADIFPAIDGISVFFRDVTRRQLVERGVQQWLDEVPVPLLRWTTDGRIREANAMVVALLGYPSREALLGHSVDDICRQAPGVPSLIEQAGNESMVHGVAVPLRRYDGSRVTALIDAILVRNEQGDVVEVLALARLPSATGDLEQSLLQSSQRYRELFEDNVTPMLIATEGGRVIACNLAMLKLVRCAGPAEGRTAHRLFGGVEAWDAYVKQLAEHGSIESQERRIVRQDSSSLRVLASGRMLRSVDRAESLVETSFVDIEARCVAEAALRRVYDEREVLLREIHHRVKNNLQIVASLLDLQAARSGGTVREFVDVSRERISAIALVHERLYQSKDLASIRLSEYLQVLIDSVGESQGIDECGISITSTCPDIPVGLDDGVRCGLIVNELLMNALKHAFRSRSVGGASVRVDVTLLAKSPRRTIRIRVADNGAGFPDAFDTNAQERFGMQLIMGLAHQTGGTVRWSNTPGATVDVDLVIAAHPDEHD